LNAFRVEDEQLLATLSKLSTKRRIKGQETDKDYPYNMLREITYYFNEFTMVFRKIPDLMDLFHFDANKIHFTGSYNYYVKGANGTYTDQKPGKGGSIIYKLDKPFWGNMHCYITEDTGNKKPYKYFEIHSNDKALLSNHFSASLKGTDFEGAKLNFLTYAIKQGSKMIPNVLIIDKIKDQTVMMTSDEYVRNIGKAGQLFALIDSINVGIETSSRLKNKSIKKHIFFCSAYVNFVMGTLDSPMFPAASQFSAHRVGAPRIDALRDPAKEKAAANNAQGEKKKRETV